VPTPSGRLLTQPLARQLSARERLVFVCGRYEGIDQRVLDHAATRAEVVEVSLGDYVLNGGEVAALAITEAVVRLLPGFMGNAQSLVEESHEAGLLEYPVYTRPASWQGLDVPPVLLSGDHAAIAEWRLQQARRRTAERRPDLLHPSVAASEWEVVPATPGDAGELLTLQRACWVQEALANDSLADIPPLHESLEELLAWMQSWSTWVVRSSGRLVGAVRGRLEGTAWDIGRIMVRSRRRRPRRTSCSRARAARTTSGCTRRPATASAPTSRHHRSRSCSPRAGFSPADSAVADSFLGPAGRVSATGEPATVGRLHHRNNSMHTHPYRG
jgi:tRNA (guanine37-N1)-methyltransferase